MPCGSLDDDAVGEDDDTPADNEEEAVDESGIFVEEHDDCSLFINEEPIISPLQTSLPNRMLQSMLNTGYSFEEAQAFSNACSSEPIIEAPLINSGPPPPDEEDAMPDMEAPIEEQLPFSIPFASFSFMLNKHRRFVTRSFSLFVCLLLILGSAVFWRPPPPESSSALVLGVRNGNTLFDKGASAHDLIVDSGATKHCVGHESQLDRVTIRNPLHGGVRVGSGAKLPVRAIGTMRLKVDTIRQEKRARRRSAS